MCHLRCWVMVGEGTPYRKGIKVGVEEEKRERERDSAPT